MVPSQQPIRKASHQSYNLKELNSANNLNELRRGPQALNDNAALANTLILAL